MILLNYLPWSNTAAVVVNLFVHYNCRLWDFLSNYQVALKAGYELDLCKSITEPDWCRWPYCTDHEPGISLRIINLFGFFVGISQNISSSPRTLSNSKTALQI